MLLTELLLAIRQIIILCAIPFIVYLFTSRKKQSFFSYIGLIKPIVVEQRKFIVGIVAAIVVAVAMSAVLDQLLPNGVQLANARFVNKGLAVLPGALIFSFLATALPEEILFRGFIGEHLSNRIGFAAGNTIQAVLFGLLHGATLFGVLGLWLPLLVIVFTGSLGWIMGYVNRKAGGSILPSILIHGLSNTYSCVIIMFALYTS